MMGKMACKINEEIQSKFAKTRKYGVNIFKDCPNRHPKNSKEKRETFDNNQNKH